MRNIYPVKYYSDKGFVEHKIELGDEDFEEIIREYLERQVKRPGTSHPVMGHGFASPPPFEDIPAV